MTRRPTLGIIAITTLVLMVATTIGNAVNQADAQRQQPPLNQRAVANQEGVDQRSLQVSEGLVNVQVGNANVQAQVPANVAACVICG